MLLQKYFPSSLGGMIGNSDSFSKIRDWAISWEKGVPQKPLLLGGPPGVGKTSAAYVLAKEFGWSLVEFNASDVRDKEMVEKTIMGSAVNSSFDGKLRLILVDEIDGIHGSVERGGLPSVLSVLKNAKNPVILTANEVYGDKRLLSIRGFCTFLMFKKIPSHTMGKFLREVCEKENIGYDVFSISALAKRSSGDVRGSLLDLETYSSLNNTITVSDVESSGYRESSENIFSVMHSLFVSKSLNEIRKTRFSSEVDLDLLKKWVEENIPRQFPMPLSISVAYDQLSRGDVFDGRIFRRQHYGFMKYSSDLVSSVGLNTPERKHGFISYQFPSILKKLSLAKGSGKKQLVDKIQKKMRGSRSSVFKEIPYWRLIIENSSSPSDWVDFFSFDEDDLSFLLQINSKSKKIQSLLKKDFLPEKEKKSSSKKKQKNSSFVEEKPIDSIEQFLPEKKGEEKDDFSPSPDQTSLSHFLGKE